MNEYGIVIISIYYAIEYTSFLKFEYLRISTFLIESELSLFSVYENVPRSSESKNICKPEFNTVNIPEQSLTVFF
jgi:hypothetical protein